MSTPTAGARQPYARAQLQCSTYPDEARLIFHSARVDDRYDYVALNFHVDGWMMRDYEQLMAELDDFTYTPPRTLRRRRQVVEMALRVVDRLGWTLTPDELELVERMAKDRTLEGDIAAEIAAERAA